MLICASLPTTVAGCLGCYPLCAVHSYTHTDTHTHSHTGTHLFKNQYDEHVVMANEFERETQKEAASGGAPVAAVAVQCDPGAAHISLDDAQI
jgi:hypothetical protein